MKMNLARAEHFSKVYRLFIDLYSTKRVALSVLQSAIPKGPGRTVNIKIKKY